MRILLIKPPIRAFHKLTAGTRHVPTGLMYLAHAVRDLPVETRIFDSLLWPADSHVVPHSELRALDIKKISSNPIFRHLIHHGARWERLFDEVRSFDPDVVGITCLFSPYYHSAYRAAEVVRSACPEAKILMGGPHATVMWRDVLERSTVDGIILGEGEQAFRSLIAELLAHGRGALRALDVDRHPGLCVRRARHDYAINRRRCFVEDLDGLGFPALPDVDFARYGGVAAIITSRGCPFSCSFCSVHAIVGKAFRARSPESVVDELAYLQSRGVHTVNVEDDNFTFDMARVDAIMELICRRGIKVEIRFPNGITAIRMNKERVRLFAKSGVRRLFFGLESVQKERRKKIKKPFANLERIEELIHHAKKEGIYAFVSLIAGMPDQSSQEIADDLAYLFARGIGSATNAYYPIVGTDLFKQTRDLGLLEEDDLEWYEPMNFSIQSQSFSRQDVAEAFVMGKILADPSLKKFHELFLLQNRSHTRHDVKLALIDLGLFGVERADGWVVSANPCFCDDQGISMARRERESGGGVCHYSAAFLRLTLQLWRRRQHHCWEIDCRAGDESASCRFMVQETGPLQGLSEQFMRQLQVHCAELATA
jgi:anaerobic magnesium-protoporphyrin IX monomethyl ester cyclase